MPGRKPIFLTITLTASYVAISPTPLVGDFVISALESNTGNMYFQGDDATDVAVSPDDWYEFRGVNLAAISVKGVAGDKVTIIGQA